MRKTPLFAAAASAAFFTLSACGDAPPEVVNSYDPQAEALANAAPVQLPPAVTVSRTYRCSDNSLAYVDFYNNNTAIFRRTQSGAATNLSQANGAGPFTAEGISVSGSGENVTINGKSCHT
jgi:hypothetical protein